MNVFSLIIIVAALAISLIIIMIVSIGMRRKTPGDASELTLFMAKTGQHLNGEAEPPAGLVKIAGALPTGRGAQSASERG